VVHYLSELVADAEAAFGKAPFNIQIRAADTARAAFEAAFMVTGNAVAFQPVNIGRTKIEAGLVFAFVFTDFTIYYL
jgi:hypothetical protein